MSQTIADGLQGIINAKSNIDRAVEAKGGIVTKGLENSADDIMTIPNGEGPSYRSAVLWDYTTDNSGTIPYEPFTGTLQDNINNYDAIQLEMVSYIDDLDDPSWNATMFTPIIPVYVLNNSLKNNYFNHTSFERRSTNWYIKDTTVQKISTNESETNGLVRVYGIKFYGGGGTVADEDALIELVDSGAKNLSEWAGGTTETDDSFVVQNEPIALKKGTYVISFDTTADSGSCEVVFSDANDNVGSHTFDNISSSTLSSEITLTADAIKFNLSTTKAATITNFMICTKAAWGMSHEYQPYRPSYQELYEQTETNESNISKDEAALVELIDGVEKNLWDFKNATPADSNNIRVITKTDTNIKVRSTGAWSRIAYPITLPAGNYVLSTVIGDYQRDIMSTNVFTKIKVATQADGSDVLKSRIITGNGHYTLEFESTGDTIYIVYCPNDNSRSYTNRFEAASNMICTKAAWDISQTYQPHRPSYQEIYEQIETNKNNISLLQEQVGYAISELEGVL